MKILNILLILFFTNLYAETLEKVTLQLQWKHQFEFAGFYAAKEKGFYKEAGLDVDFKEFNKTIKISDAVLNGGAEYGLAYSSIVAEYASGKPFILVANFFKQSPLVLLVQKDIHVPADLKGKRVMGINDSIHNMTLLSMLSKFNVHKDDVISVPRSFDINDFISKKIDAMSIFTTNELYYISKSGIQYNILDPVVYGAKYYDQNLFTTQFELSNHPKRVQKMREASIKGWKYALTHKDELIDIILKKYNPQNKSKEALAFEAAQIEQIILPNVYEVGSIDVDRFRIIADSFKQAGFIAKNVKIDLQAFIYDYKANKNSLNLTLNEREYLKLRKEIRVCVDPNWMPFEAVVNGTLEGINKDFLDIVQKRLGIPLELVQTSSWSDSLEYAKNRKCDIVSLVSKTKERQTYLNITEPHLIVPQVLVTKSDVPTVIDIGMLEDKTVACVKNYSIIEMIKRKYKNLKIVEVQNVQEGLNMVSEDRVFGFADTSAAIGYTIEKEMIPNLKINAGFDDKVELGVGVRSDDVKLFEIVQKAFQSITQEQKQTIIKKWFSIKHEKEFDYALFYQMIGLFLIVVAFFVYRHFELKKINRELKKLFEEEAKKSKDKDEIIFNQKKLAAMDEVLENIAHQWRQPLSQVNSAVLIIDDRMYEKNFKDDVIEEKLLEIESLTQYMSKTIDDFKNFFHEQKKKEKFSIKDLVDKSIYIIKGTLLSLNISVENRIDRKFFYKGHPNELEQVILVLLNNAKDVLSSRKIQYPKITVECFEKEGDYYITVEDNAGGIDESIIDKIFDPYFTTKHKTQGTGLGLYISQMMIKEKMNAELSVKNSKIGALFTIKLKAENGE